jgi:hypothetical protein
VTETGDTPTNADPGLATALEEAGKLALNYSTCLFSRRGDDGKYVGSGTFVRVGEHRCLLTAAHVWEALADSDGVAFLTDARRPALLLRTQVLTCLHASAPSAEGWTRWGPDLALVEIPSVFAGKLEVAGKSFYDLTRRRENALAAGEDTSGLWVVPATFGENVSLAWGDDEILRATVQIKEFVSTPRRTEVRATYDYVDLAAVAVGDPAAPTAYGGMSGAGAWIVGKEKDGLFRWDRRRVVLAGVAFYHDKDDPTEEVIRCHGTRSIYGSLLDAVLSR